MIRYLFAVSGLIILCSPVAISACENIEYQELITFTKSEFEEQYCEYKYIMSNVASKDLHSTGKQLDTILDKVEGCNNQMAKLYRIYLKRFKKDIRKAKCPTEDSDVKP